VPELPEVETIVRELAPRLVGRRLRDPRLHQTDILYHTTRRRVLRALSGSRVSTMTRRAKHAVIQLSSGFRLVIQPGMTGSLLVYDRPLSADERRYAVLEASVGKGETFVYRDVRRLGTLLLLDEDAWAAYTARLGPEPLARDFDLDRFVHSLSGSRQAVKKVIMDQRRLAGVGNIYANEALFLARLDPSLPANQVDRPAAARLYRAVRSILAGAIRAKGTTFRDYRTGKGKRGAYQFSLKVYGRGGEPCRRCRARLATTHAIDGRATTFCWKCQTVGRSDGRTVGTTTRSTVRRSADPPVRR
jgi:formamidopyrimidine-DNA glycosylase